MSILTRASLLALAKSIYCVYCVDIIYAGFC